MRRDTIETIHVDEARALVAKWDAEEADARREAWV
jgi:hypothetical protein